MTAPPASPGAPTRRVDCEYVLFEELQSIVDDLDAGQIVSLLAPRSLADDFADADLDDDDDDDELEEFDTLVDTFFAF